MDLTNVRIYLNDATAEQINFLEKEAMSQQLTFDMVGNLFKTAHYNSCKDITEEWLKYAEEYLDKPKQLGSAALFYTDVYSDIIKILGLKDNMIGETLIITLDPGDFVKVIRKGAIKK